MDNVLTMLVSILFILIFLIVVCAIILYFLKIKKKQSNKEKNNEEYSESTSTQSSSGIRMENVKKFLNFDEIKNNMIIRNGRTQYLMVIQCQGVNYDLLSEEEKVAVEEGFVQFLNTLRFPIQLYVQTQSLNLENIVDEYKSKIHVIENDIKILQRKINQAEALRDTRTIEKLRFELKRKTNVSEYGADITNYVSRLSLNKNVLKQKTYIIVTYYTSEFNGNNKFNKEEADNIFFSELYTRTKMVLRAIGSAGVTGRILDSEELAELLYVAYNRDDANMLPFSKGIQTQYDSLYTTGKDVLKKKAELIDEKIEEEAVNLVTESIEKADEQIREEQQKMEEAIIKRAQELAEEHKHQMTNQLYKKTKEQINKRGRKPKTDKPVTTEEGK